MLRAVLVGFILGFALVGVIRLAQPDDLGPQLTSGQLLNRGAAVDHVRLNLLGESPCRIVRRDMPILI